MFIRRGLFGAYARLMDAAGADGAAGGGGDDGTNKGAEGATGTDGVAGVAADAGKGDKPTDKEAQLLKEVMERKGKQRQLEEQLTDIRSKLSAFDGLDAAAIRKLVQEQKDAETQALEKKGEWEKIKQQMVVQHNTELDALKAKVQEANGLVAQRDSTIDQLTLGNAFASSSVIPKELAISPRAARVEFGSYFSRDENGNVVGYDKPMGIAGRAPLVDASGNPLNFDAALQKVVDSHPNADDFKRDKTRAGGDSGTQKGGKKDDSDDPGVGVSRINAALASGGLKRTALKIGAK